MHVSYIQVVVSVGRLGKILTILILTRDRKVTMTQLTSVKLDTRYVDFIVCAYCVCWLLLTKSYILHLAHARVCVMLCLGVG